MQRDSRTTRTIRALRTMPHQASASITSLPGGVRWSVYYGIPVVAVLSILFIISGFRFGWWPAYDLLLGIRSPGDLDEPLLAVPLSLVGWLLVPAVVGACAGYMVERQIYEHRGESLAQSIAQSVVDQLGRSNEGSR